MVQLKNALKILFVVVIAGLFLTVGKDVLAQSDPTQEGSVGLSGTISSPPPTQGATITTPTNGQVFTSLPITVAGLCPQDLLVEIFKNNVFAGSTQCKNGSYSLQIDLFSGRNDLIARVYDSLNQAGPDSNTVTVFFNDSLPGTGPRISLTTPYAKRGANVGETLTWPITLSGGTGPYAISVDWGDKTAPDLISRETAGEFVIQHIYNQSGVYNVIVKATDANDDAAFLQLVGVGNGPIQQSSGDSKATPTVVSTRPISDRVIAILLLVVLLTLLMAFWLGRKHQLQVIRDKIRRGERPF